MIGWPETVTGAHVLYPWAVVEFFLVGRSGVPLWVHLGGGGGSTSVVVGKVASLLAGRTASYKFDCKSRPNVGKSKKCNYCHEIGHWKAECPVLQVRGKGFISNVKPKP